MNDEGRDGREQCACQALPTANSKQGTRCSFARFISKVIQIHSRYALLLFYV
jgi:hypothetical protein